MRQHVFNLAGNRATVTLYDTDNLDDWTVKVYREGIFITSKDNLSEHDAISLAKQTLDYWKGIEDV